MIWPAVLAAIAGSYRGVWGSFISNGAVFILLGMVLTFYPQGPKTHFYPSLLAPTSLFLVKGLALLLRGSPPYGWIQVLFEAFLSWGLAQIFIEALSTPRLEERMLGLGLFLAGILLGIQGIRFMGVSWQLLLTYYFLLLASLAGGAGMGAAWGAALGLLPSLAQFAPPLLAGLLAFVGLAAGYLRIRGKLGVLGGFLLSQLLLGPYFLGQEGIALKEWGGAACLSLLTPLPW